MGKINFYRKFISKSTILLEPFQALLRKNFPFCWSPEFQSSFDKVKRLLTSELIFAVFDHTRPIFIYTDASAVGIGAVLKQEQTDGFLKPVAYFSKKLTKSQGQRKAIYLESLAVWEAVRYWQFCLLDQHFTIITDCKPLQDLNLKARTDEELGDFANELLQFDFQILYCPGSSNSEADYLSHNPVLEPSSNSSEHILPSFNFLSSFQSNIIKSDTDVVRKGVIYQKFRN